MNQVEQDKEKKNETKAKNITKALAIVGLIALLAVAAWLAVQGLRTAPSFISKMKDGGAAVTLSSLFSRAKESDLSITLDKTVVNSGEPLTLSINDASGANRYAISYECKDDASFSIQGADSASTTNATCNTPAVITSASGTVTIVPTSKNTRYLDVYITVASVSADGTLSDDTKDTALVTVVNDATSTATTSKPTASTTAAKPASRPTASAKPSPVYNPAPVRPVATGPADLAVTIVGTGVSLGNNEFVKTTVIPTASRGAVKFVVENKGGVATGPWGFTANLPIEGDNGFRYASPLQKSLNAGDKIEFVLGFDQILKESTGTIKITLLPADKTDKTTNNTAQATVVIKNK